MFSGFGFSGRATLVLAISALVAGAVVWGGFRPNDLPAAQPASQATNVAVQQTRILVASRTVLPGNPVSPDDFQYVDMPVDSVHDGFLADTEQHRARSRGWPPLVEFRGARLLSRPT